MQIVIALVALPAVALLLALASRLEDGLRAQAYARPPHALDPWALPAGEQSQPPAGAHARVVSPEPEPSAVRGGG
jgi:hypothetical protein